jgi:hypothetical protein
MTAKSVAYFTLEGVRIEPVPNHSKKRSLLYGGGGGDRTSSKRQQKAWPSIRWRGWGLKVGIKPVPNDSKRRGLLYNGGGGNEISSKRQQTAWPSLRRRGWGWNQFRMTAKSVVFFTVERVGMEPVPNDSKKRGLLYDRGGEDGTSSKRQQKAWLSIWWRGWG